MRAGRTLLPALRAELRRLATTRLWWGLLLVVAALAVLMSGLAPLPAEKDTVGDSIFRTVDDARQVLLRAEGNTLRLVVLFPAVYGVVSAAGEFRHRTITSTYLAAGGRGRVLVAKALVGALVGALYAAVAAVLVAWVLILRDEPPAIGGPLLAVTAAGAAVAALWGVLGVAVGMLVANQAGALAGLLLYSLGGELALATLSSGGSSPALALYLPGRAGDVAIAGVVQFAWPSSSRWYPSSWGVGLVLLTGWAVAAVVAARAVGDRRDVG